MLLWVPYAAAQFPERTVRLLVGFGAGGGTDISARLLARSLTETWGRSVVVENRPGADAAIATAEIARARPDGYNLLVTTTAIAITPAQQKQTWDPQASFEPITLIGSAHSLVVVHPSLPVHSVKELIALAKARPGELNYSTSGTGSSNHLPAELFQYLAGVKLVRINYKGAGPALVGVMSGEAQVMFATATSATPHMASGRVRGLAVTSAKRSALVNLPTIAESGVPGYDFAGPIGLVAPARTPPAVINRLNQEIVRALRQPHMAKRIMDSGAELVASTPAEYGATIAAEIATWGKVIRQGGLTVP